MNTEAIKGKTLGSQADNARLTAEEILQHEAVAYLIATNATQTAAAKKFGLAQQTLSNWVERLREEGYAAQLPRHLRERRGGGSTTPKKYPIVAHVPAGYQDGVVDADPDPIGWYTADTPVRLIGDKLPPFAFRVVGDSMTNPEEPVQFEDGDVVLVDPNRRLTLNNHDFVVASNYAGKMTLKQFLYLTVGGEKKRLLHALNPAYPDLEINDVDHWIVGVVVEGKRPEKLLYSLHPKRR